MMQQKTMTRHFLDTVQPNNRVGSHVNCIRISTANTKEHELRKFEVCWELRKRGHDILTEAVFGNESRCDVIDITAGIIYEILHTETEKEADEKFAKYPMFFQIRYVKTSDPWDVKLLD